MNKTEASKAMRNGAITGFVILVINIIAMIVVMSKRIDSGPFAYMSDPIITIVGLTPYLLCSIALLYRQNWAALIMLLVFILDKIAMLLEGSMSKASIILALVFLYLFARAAQGSYVYHKIEAQENPNYRPTPKWKFYVGIPIGLVIVALYIIGLMFPEG